MSVATLAELAVGGRARVVDLDGSPAVQQRIAELGLVPGSEVGVVRVAPLGDPIEVEVMGYRLSLRKTEAAVVLVEVL